VPWLTDVFSAGQMKPSDWLVALAAGSHRRSVVRGLRGPVAPL